MLNGRKLNCLQGCHNISRNANRNEPLKNERTEKVGKCPYGRYLSYEIITLEDITVVCEDWVRKS